MPAAFPASNASPLMPMKGEAMVRAPSPRRSFLPIALLAVSMAIAACRPSPDLPTREENHARASVAVEAAETDLIAFRHDLHRYPELSLEEERTARKIAERLGALGFEVRTNVGGHGVVGILRGPRGGRTIAFRADMDASRDFSDDPVPYASTVKGVAHNCGHDMHSTIGIGLAVGFAAIQETLPGTIMLIFQPAEETGTGARAMIADGIFDDLKPDAILALHTFPVEVGTMVTRPSTLMAGRAQLIVKLTGNGDLNAGAARVRAALDQVSTVTPQNSVKPAAPSFIYIDLASQKPGTDEGEVFVRGLVMSAGIDQRAAVEQEVTSAIRKLNLEDIQIDIFYQQALEGVNNDPVTVQATAEAITSLNPSINLGMDADIFPAFSEDFGSFQQEVPGVMYFLGVNNTAKGTIGFPHTPSYIADDSAISVGTRAMLAASLALMEGAVADH